MDEPASHTGAGARAGSVMDARLPAQGSSSSARFQAATVKDVIAETFDTRSFALELEQTWTHRPGQHIRVAVEIHGRRHERYYSLSNTPQFDGPKITVKRNPRGLVSAWLVGNLAIGSRIEVSEPEGDFVLQTGTKEALYLAAGSGITPIASMIRLALSQGRAVRLLHVDRTPADGIFRAEFRHLASRYPRFKFEPWFTSLRGRPDRQLKELISAAEEEIYVCGPQGFSDRCIELAAAAGIAPDRVRQESFGAVGSPEGEAIELFLRQPDGSLTALQGRVGATLLEVLREQLNHPSICGGRGICGTCRVAIEQKYTSRFNPAARSEARLLSILAESNPNHRLACQVRLTAEHDGVCFAAAPLNSAGY